MRVLRPVVFFVLLCALFNACEKDDICVDGDTPLLVVGFFDTQDSITEKEVPSLRIKAVELDAFPDTFTDRTNQDSIGIPLRIDSSVTNYIFIINSTDEEDVETGIRDTLNFNYLVNEKFISRACGFIANYAIDTVQGVNATSNWIQGIEIIEPTVEFSNQIHVKIYH